MCNSSICPVCSGLQQRKGSQKSPFNNERKTRCSFALDGFKPSWDGPENLLLRLAAFPPAAGAPRTRGAAGALGGRPCQLCQVLLRGPAREAGAVHDVGVQHLQQQVIQRHHVLHLHGVQVVHAFVAAQLFQKGRQEPSVTPRRAFWVRRESFYLKWRMCESNMSR